MIANPNNETIALIEGGKIITYLRPDLPEGWRPAEGQTLMLASAAAGLPRADDETEPSLISRLAAAFRAAVPEEFQGQFGETFAAIRVLVDNGEFALARATIEAKPVPPELDDAKQFLIALLPIA